MVSLVLTIQEPEFCAQDLLARTVGRHVWRRSDLNPGCKPHWLLTLPRKLIHTAPLHAHCIPQINKPLG